MERDFRTQTRAQWDRGLFLCVGLDSELEKIPEPLRAKGVDGMLAFNKAIIDATKDTAGFYKPNTAFYEAHGAEGISMLRETIRYIQSVAPETAVILDAKRGDIGNTNNGYVAFAFDYLGADAITIQPYMGAEAVRPFLERAEKGIFALCRTSNQGSEEFQDLSVDGVPLYQVVAQCVREKWNENGNCGLVVGATYPEQLAEVRTLAGDIPILIPGVGAQGGDLEAAVRAAKDSSGRGFLLAVSRAILFASSGADFAEAARTKAEELHAAIKAAL